MYNYFYNNVVDFNNAINSYWPQVEDKATEGNNAKPTGNDYLSNLPPEILTEMMMYLPLEDVQVLSLTNRKIKPTTEPVIKFRTNLRTQELLETIDIYSIGFRLKFKPGTLEVFKADVERAKTFQNGSDERVQALRDAICTHKGEISLETLFSSFENNPIFTDKSLVVQLMKSLTLNSDRCTFKYNYDKINNKKFDHNKINNEILFLNLLKTTEIQLKELEVEIFNVASVPGKLIEALVEALRENQSINEVSITWENCDLVQLDSILEAIKNNERIVKCDIRDTGSKRNCCGKEWSWEKSTKEKSYKEFEDLIKNKLSPTFQILEKDRYGQFPCVRLPV